MNRKVLDLIPNISMDFGRQARYPRLKSKMSQVG